MVSAKVDVSGFSIMFYGGDSASGFKTDQASRLVEGCCNIVRLEGMRCTARSKTGSTVIWPN